jgi:hypothetical protein
MSDYILVKMPDTLYEFLQAMAVVQDYSVVLATGAQRELREPGKHRDSNYQFTFRMNEKFRYFEPCLKVVQDNTPIFDYSGWDEDKRGEYDCFIRFDADMFKRGKIISIGLQAHIVAGLNTLVGTGAMALPVVKPLQLTQDPSMVTDVLILNWDDIESKKFYDFILINYPQLEVILDAREYSTYTPEDIFNYVNSFKCVIGPYGVCTYVAAMLKKLVIELFKTNELGILYGVAGAPDYVAVVGETHTAKFLWTVWENKICPELLSKMKSQEEQTLVGTQVSIVDHVQER